MFAHQTSAGRVPAGCSGELLDQINTAHRPGRSFNSQAQVLGREGVACVHFDCRKAKGSKINALCDLCFVDGEHYFEVEAVWPERAEGREKGLFKTSLMGGCEGADLCVGSRFFGFTAQWPQVRKSRAPGGRTLQILIASLSPASVRQICT